MDAYVREIRAGPLRRGVEPDRRRSHARLQPPGRHSPTTPSGRSGPRSSSSDGRARVAEDRPAWPRFRAAVNTGPARVGVVGGAYTPLGDAVNLGARLEGEADVGEVVVGAATYRELPDGTQARPLGEIQVKGKEAPVEAYVVLGLPGEELGRAERRDDDAGLGRSPRSPGRARRRGPPRARASLPRRRG